MSTNKIMGFIHISDLYKDKTILEYFKECVVSEKIEGSTVSFKWEYLKKTITIDPGPATEEIVKTVIPNDLLEKFQKHFPDQDIEVIGELYGSKQYLPKKSAKYNVELGFIMFKAKANDFFLSIHQSFDISKTLGIEFVNFGIYPTQLEELDKLRDMPSYLGISKGKVTVPREGIVVEPVIPFLNAYGQLIIAKYKAKEERETKTERKVGEDLAVLEKANEIAEEWVTETRLEHVIQKVPNGREKSATVKVLEAMVEDVFREGKGEIVESKEAVIAIKRKCAQLLKKVYEGK